MPNNPTVYTKPFGCGGCIAVKGFFKRRGIEINEVDATTEEGGKAVAALGFMRVPVVHYEGADKTWLFAEADTDQLAEIVADITNKKECK